MTVHRPVRWHLVAIVILGLTAAFVAIRGEFGDSAIVASFAVATALGVLWSLRHPLVTVRPGLIRLAPSGTLIELLPEEIAGVRLDGDELEIELAKGSHVRIGRPTRPSKLREIEEAILSANERVE